jgi:hypothetical protein
VIFRLRRVFSTPVAQAVAQAAALPGDEKLKSRSQARAEQRGKKLLKAIKPAVARHRGSATYRHSVAGQYGTT